MEPISKNLKIYGQFLNYIKITFHFIELNLNLGNFEQFCIDLHLDL
jgi:hypothetical protein